VGRNHEQVADRVGMAGMKEQLPSDAIHSAQRRLLILACSATKSAAEERIPATERYDGPLWQTLRAVDPNRQKAYPCFLSAKYGFGPAWRPLPDYNAFMTKELAAEMIRLGTVDGTWPKTKCGMLPGGHALAAMASICHAFEVTYGQRVIEEVCLVGGHLYLDVMRSFIQEFQEHRLLPRNLRVTEINGPIGKMRQSLRCWLAEAAISGAIAAEAA
jgi:hypothetical protein